MTDSTNKAPDDSSAEDQTEPLNDAKSDSTDDVAESIEARYPEFTNVSIDEFEDILADEASPLNDAAQRLAREVMKPAADSAARLMASVSAGKLDAILSPYAKQMSEYAASLAPKIDYGAIMASAGLDRARQSMIETFSKSIPTDVLGTAGFSPATFAAARQAESIASHLKSIPQVKIPQLEYGWTPPTGFTKAAESIASQTKLPEIFDGSDVKLTPVLTTPNTHVRSNSVGSWVEEMTESTTRANRQIDLSEAMARSMDEMNQRSQEDFEARRREAEAAASRADVEAHERREEAEVRRIDHEASVKREERMHGLTKLSVWLVAISVIVSTAGIVISTIIAMNPPAPTEQPAPPATTVQTPEPLIPAPESVTPPTEPEPELQQP